MTYTRWWVALVAILGAAWVGYAWGRFRRGVLNELRAIRQLLERWTRRNGDDHG